MKKTLIVAIMLSNLSALAGTYFLKPVKVVGVETEKLAEVVTTLVESALLREGHVVLEDEEKSDNTISTSIVSLDDTFILTMKVKGDERNTVQFKTQAVNELDTGINRGIEALVNGDDFSDSKKRGALTISEMTKNKRRIGVMPIISFGLGPNSFSNMNNDGGLSLNFGYGWSFDEKFDLTMNYDYSFHTKDNSTYSSIFTFRGDYHLFEGNSSPFVSLDFGYGGFKSGDDRVNGWVYGVGLGYKFYRASNVNFGVDLRHIRASDQYENGETPGVTTARFTVYF